MKLEILNEGSNKGMETISNLANAVSSLNESDNINAKNSITFSKDFKYVKNIVDSLSKNELYEICDGKFVKSPYVKYREVMMLNNEPVSFIEVYTLPNMDKNTGIIVIATKQKYRHNSYADILVGRMKKNIKGINVLLWEVNSNNANSISLAEKNQFTNDSKSMSNNKKIVYSFKIHDKGFNSNFDIATAIKDRGFYNDGVWNSLIEKDGKYYRERGETFVFKGKKVFCQIRDNGTIKLPGGSTERGMTNIAAAEKEIHEEMRATVTNMKETGVVYILEQKPSEWMSILPIEYNGRITTIYTAKYKGKYTGKIDKADYDDLYLKGKWYNISDIYDYCNKYQKEVLSRYMKPIEEAICNIASETVRSIARRAIYESDNSSILNDDAIPITPCYTPDEMEALGVFNDDPSLNRYGKSTSYGAQQWFHRYKVTGDVGDGYFDTIVSLHPGTDMSDEAKQTCLEYGWNPDITLEEAGKMQYKVREYLKEQYNSVDIINVTEADIDEDVKFKADMINLYNIVKDKVIDLRAGEKDDPLTIASGYINFVGESPEINEEDAKIGYVHHDKLHLIKYLITVLNNHIAGKDQRYKLMIVGEEMKATFYDIRIVANTAVSGTEMIHTSDIVAESTDHIKSIDDFIKKYN